MEHSIPVVFEGHVLVKTPGHLCQQDARLLADGFALARIVAVVENPDGPDDAACVEYLDLSTGSVARDWDDTTVLGVSGSWSISEVAPTLKDDYSNDIAGTMSMICDAIACNGGKVLSSDNDHKSGEIYLKQANRRFLIRLSKV